MSSTIAAANAGPPEFRAGATDLTERRRSGISRGALIDIAGTPANSQISWGTDGAARIGALVTVAQIASDARIAAAYPGLAAAAGALATPQIRHLATIGGNLAQRSRCWYYRNPHFACLKKGGADCPARAGNHLYGVAFDLGPCVAPHPSTLAAALMIYEGRIHTNRRQALTIEAMLGDGTDGRTDNKLESGELIESIALPPPLAGEHALYKRAISRTHAEWPLVEVCARAVVAGGTFRSVRIAAGGVAPVPLRLRAAEAAVEGAPADEAAIMQAAKLATTGAKPLAMTAYKLDLLSGLVQDLLERLAARVGE